MVEKQDTEVPNTKGTKVCTTLIVIFLNLIVKNVSAPYAYYIFVQSLRSTTSSYLYPGRSGGAMGSQRRPQRFLEVGLSRLPGRRSSKSLRSQTSIYSKIFGHGSQHPGRQSQQNRYHRKRSIRLYIRFLNLSSIT